MNRWTGLWAGLWALGAVLLIVGAVLLFVPVVSSGPHTVTPPDLATQDRWYFVEDNVTGFTVTGNVPLTLDWSASAMLYLDYAICSHPQSNFSDFFRGNFSTADCNEVYGVQGSSTQSNSWSVPAGGSVVLAWGLFTYGPHNISITYTFWAGLTIAGPVLLTLGAVSIGLGVITLMWARRPKTPEAAATGTGTREAGSQGIADKATEPR